LKKRRGFQDPPQRHIPDAIQQKLQQALVLHQQGILSDAKKIYEDILKRTPNCFDALHLLGVIAYQTKNLDQAKELIGKAIKANPNNAAAYSNRGNVLQDLKRFDEALISYDKAIALKPDYAEAYNNRGNALKDLRRLDEALASCDKAIALKPDYAEAYNSRGNALQDLRRLDEALASYDKAIALKPDYAEGYNNRGNVLKEFKRFDEAFSAYDKALALKPDLAEAWLGRGNVLNDLNRLEEAFSTYDKALALKADLAEAWLGRGNVLTDFKRSNEAFSAYDKALALKPDLADAWLGRGNVFYELKRYDDALAAYDKAFTIKPDLISLEGIRLHTKMLLCEWRTFSVECAHLISSVKSGKVNTQPFPFLAISASPEEQLQCARLWKATKYPPSENPIWQGERYSHNRIRLAYLSADFREHPISFLMAGVFECHDKSRFDVTAISCGPDDNSKIRQRLEMSFEHFIDVKTYSDDQIAKLIKELEVDILIDLMGFTKGARTGIFAKRPAPIQVNYLGYPGTMGTEYIDYIIADRIVIPDNQRNFYSEKIAFLPNSYQANDGDRSISDKTFTRSEFELPPTGFVFCCFNNNYKITPSIFYCWMRILNQVDGSVLWLLENSATATINLQKEAVSRGVAAERIVFAKRMPPSDHLARHHLADLFLDTLPYNAHTTASDALWAGLPVLTCAGETFAGRVSASLLNAIGLPELITTKETYEQMALDLAGHPDKLNEVKQRLTENRLAMPLFDTKLFTKHIEAAYSAMYERHQVGLTPDHIVIPN
jgi:protein O-GlcNAc transferase